MTSLYATVQLLFEQCTYQVYEGRLPVSAYISVPHFHPHNIKHVMSDQKYNCPHNRPVVVGVQPSLK